MSSITLQELCERINDNEARLGTQGFVSIFGDGSGALYNGDDPNRTTCGEFSNEWEMLGLLPFREPSLDEMMRLAKVSGVVTEIHVNIDGSCLFHRCQGRTTVAVKFSTTREMFKALKDLADEAYNEDE